MGCAREETHESATTPAASAQSEVELLDETPAGAVFTPPHEPDVPMPGPRRKRLAAAVELNATCTSCHDEETKEWRRSYHQRANIDPAYVKAFAIEPSPFCRGCHAPEADPRKEPPKAVSELGVACVTCHVTEEGLVLAADRGDGASRGPAPHALRRSKAFAHQGGCANCHEFHFPMPGGDEDAMFMQTTAREHLRSPSAARACADCHMPLEKGRRSHSFAHVRDAAWLRKNLEVKVDRARENTLRVTLVQPNAGHDAPTGDLFRRYEIGYEVRSEDGTVLRRETQYVGRFFDIVPGRPGRTLTKDNRVTAEPRIVDLPLPQDAPPTGNLRWWVTYQRVATVGTGENPANAIIESFVELHSGSFPWTQNQPSTSQP